MLMAVDVAAGSSTRIETHHHAGRIRPVDVIDASAQSHRHPEQVVLQAVALIEGF
jgi:hypothetical protein